MDFDFSIQKEFGHYVVRPSFEFSSEALRLFERHGTPTLCFGGRRLLVTSRSLQGAFVRLRSLEQAVEAARSVRTQLKAIRERLDRLERSCALAD